MTLELALARALKYNLDQRVQLLEQSIAIGTWKAGKYDLLPKIQAIAGHRSRDKDLVSRSIDSVTGQPSLANPFISSERQSELYDLGISWTLLDFTMGYFNAKQNADRILIAAEARRKAMHALNRDVTIAFWRMASAQRMRQDVESTLVEAERAIADSAQAGSEAIQAPIDQLRYQRQILENIRLLGNIDKEFATARVTLAKLINAPVGTDFTVLEPSDAYTDAMLQVPVEQMEELALQRNADLRQNLYSERIAAVDVKKSMARLLPNLSLSYNLRQSTDDYLIHQNWNEAAYSLSQNLTHLLSLPANRRNALAGVELARQRTVATQMALVAQVHIARLNLAGQYKQLQLAERIWSIDAQIKQQTGNRQSAQAASQLSKVASDTAAIVSLLRRYQALAEYHAASGALQATLGMEVDLSNVQDQSVEQLAGQIQGWMNAWHRGDVSAASSPPAFDVDAALSTRAASSN